MKVANISETKNNLSSLLSLVKQGETISIVERNTVVAWLIPPPSSDSVESGALENLERRGLITRNPKTLDVKKIAQRAVRLPAKVDLLTSLLSNREEER